MDEIGVTQVVGDEEKEEEEDVEHSAAALFTGWIYSVEKWR